MNDVEKKIKFRSLASGGDLQGVNRMLGKGFPVPRGALSVAASNGHAEVVRRLLRAGDYSKGDVGELASSLCYAANGKQMHVVRILLDCGASPDSGAGRFLGVPVLLIAAEKGMTELVKLLLETGANPDAHDIPPASDLLGITISRTALMVASEKGRTEIVHLLLEAGADPSIKGIKGKTAYELIAKRKDRQVIAKLLLEWTSRKTAGANARQPKAGGLKVALSGKVSNWQDAMTFLSNLCEATPVPHLQVEKIQMYKLSAARVRELSKKRKPAARILSKKDYDSILELASQQCAPAEVSVFLTFGEGEALLCAAPWKDKFKTIATLRVGSVNYGMDAKKVLTVLKKINARWPFEICECGVNALRGRFTSAVDDTKKLAAALFGLCPFVVDEYSGKLGKYEKALKTERMFKLWWD